MPTIQMRFHSDELKALDADAKAAGMDRTKLVKLALAEHRARIAHAKPIPISRRTEDGVTTMKGAAKNVPYKLVPAQTPEQAEAAHQIALRRAIKEFGPTVGGNTSLQLGPSTFKPGERLKKPKGAK